MHGATVKFKLKMYFTKPVLGCAHTITRHIKSPRFDEVNVYEKLNITDKAMSLHHKYVTFWEAQCGKVLK